MDAAVGDHLGAGAHCCKYGQVTVLGIQLLAGADGRALHASGLRCGCRSGGRCSLGFGFGRACWRRSGCRCRLTLRALVLGAELGQKWQAKLFGQSFGFLRAVGQRHRQNAGLAQTVEQFLGGCQVGELAQPTEVQDDRGPPEQLRCARHAFVHFLDQSRHIKGADTQVGDAHLPNFQLTGLFVIQIHCHLRFPSAVVAAADVCCPPRGRRAGCRRRFLLPIHSCTVP
ncbi:hypothetical protein D3C81_954110 [compost metagenome]